MTRRRPDTPDEAEKHEGMCAGGPIDGKIVASEASYLVVPIVVEGEPGFGQHNYRWHDVVKMWISI